MIYSSLYSYHDKFFSNIKPSNNREVQQFPTLISSTVNLATECGLGPTSVSDVSISVWEGATYEQLDASANHSMFERCSHQPEFFFAFVLPDENAPKIQ